MNFIDNAQITLTAAGAYTATLAPTWRSMLDIHGGYVAAIAARAIELAIDEPARTLRSFTTQFIRPAHPGPVNIEVTLTKHGRTASFITAQVTQDTRPVITATAIAANRRAGLEFAETTPPANTLTQPHDTERFVGSDPGLHFAQLDAHLAPGLTMFGAHDRAHVAGWMRPLHGQGPITLPWLICAADFLPPSMVFRTDHAVEAASIDMAVQLVCSDPATAVGEHGHVYADVNSTISAEGFTVEDGTFWSPTGQLLATSRQVRLAGI